MSAKGLIFFPAWMEVTVLIEGVNQSKTKLRKKANLTNGYTLNILKRLRELGIVEDFKKIGRNTQTRLTPKGIILKERIVEFKKLTYEISNKTSDEKKEFQKTQEILEKKLSARGVGLRFDASEKRSERYKTEKRIKGEIS